MERNYLGKQQPLPKTWQRRKKRRNLLLLLLSLWLALVFQQGKTFHLDRIGAIEGNQMKEPYGNKIEAALHLHRLLGTIVIVVHPHHLNEVISTEDLSLPKAYTAEIVAIILDQEVLHLLLEGIDNLSRHKVVDQAPILDQGLPLLAGDDDP